MKVQIHHLAMDSRDGTESHVFGTEAALEDYLWQHAWDNYHDGEIDTLEAFKAAFDGDAYAAIDRHYREMLTWSSDEEEVDVTLPVPTDPVAAARAALEALVFARECFKVASAPRALDKVKDAISSAKGAVRHAEGKAVRA